MSIMETFQTVAAAKVAAPETDAEIVPPTVPPVAEEAAPAVDPEPTEMEEAVTPGGTMIEQMVAGGTPGLDGKNLELYHKLKADGAPHVSAFRGAHSFRKYELYCKMNGLDVATAPPDTITQFARATWKPQGQNPSAAHLMEALAAARAIGVAASAQTYTPTVKQPRQAVPVQQYAPPPASMQGYAPAPGVAQVPDAFQGYAPQPVYAPAPVPVPVPVPVAVRPPGKVATRPPVFPQGGRVRIHKQATGYEGHGIMPGQRITVGEMYADDVSSEGTIRDFVQRFIVPKYGPAAGSPDTTYIVEKIDDRGNVLGTFPFSFAAPLGGTGGPGAPIGGTFGTGPTPPMPPQPSTPNDKFLDYMMQKENEATKRFEELRAQLSQQKGMDPMTLMMFTEKMRPPQVDWKAVAAEFSKPASGVKDVFAGFEAPPVAPPIDQQRPLVDALTGMANRVMDAAERAQQPQPQPERAAAGELPAWANHPLFMMLAKKLIEGKDEADPAIAQMREDMRDLKAALNKPSEPSKTMAESLKDVIAMTEVMDKLRGNNGEGNGSAIVDGIQIIAENADKIGDLVGKILTMGRAPTLPKTEQKALPESQAQQQAQPPGIPPVEVQNAIIALRDAPAGEAGEQAIADAVFGLVVALQKAPEPWPKLSAAITSGFVAADSKPELHSLVVSILRNCGAKKLITEALVGKVTTVLAKHYTFIFSALNDGKQKTLLDAAPPVQAPVQVTPPTLVAAPLAPPAPVTVQPVPVPVQVPEPAPAPVAADAEEEEDGEEDDRDDDGQSVKIG